MKKLTYALMASLLVSAGSVFGAGFAIVEQSTVGLGRGLAGMTAEFDDPGALYFNPSVGAWHETRDLMIGTHVVAADVKFHDRGSIYSGDENGNVGNIALVPNLYYIHPVADGISLNMGISATSGTSISYSDDWIGRYFGISTEVKVIEFAPSISWRINEQWAVGFGVIIQDAGLEIDQAVPAGAVSKIVSAKAGHPITLSGDSKVKLKGDSTAFGFTAGISYRPFEGTRLGLGYRSAITHDGDLNGKTRLSSSFPPPVAAAIPHHFDADLELNLPDVINFGIQQDIGEKWTIDFDVAWSNWSCMEKLELENDLLPGAGDKMNWKDSWRFSLGADYKVNEKFTFRFGGTYDMSPVKNEELRTVRLPDVDRFWASMGLTWNYTEATSFDFAYTHLFFDSADIDNQGVKGTYYGSCELFSFAMTHRF